MKLQNSILNSPGVMLQTKSILKGNSSANRQGRVMYLMLCNFLIASYLPNIDEISRKYLKWSWRYAPDKWVSDGRTDGQTDRDYFHIP